MRLAFIPTAYRTPFFLAVGQRLEQAGHTVFWLSPNNRWSRWLHDQQVAAERVFDITQFAAEWKDTPRASVQDRAELALLEKQAGWNAHDVLIMDELLRQRSTDYALRYLAVCARRTQEFLNRHAIQIVFGEQTWAFELLLGQVCSARSVPFLRPVLVRIPEARFVFCPTRFEKDILFKRSPTPEDRLEGLELLQRYRSRPAPPAYSTANWHVFRFQWQRLWLICKHVYDVWRDPHDETTLGPMGLIAKYVAKSYRSRRNRWLGVFQRPEFPPRRPFVFVPLHLEPEASIDVMGNPFTNQRELVRALARTVPATHELWVKEHCVAMANRTPSFYRELAAIPGVRLIDPFVNSLAVIPHADLSVSVTGTVCYEAAILGRPSATMMPTIFSPILLTDRFNPFTDSVSRLLDQARLRTSSEGGLQDYFAWLYANSWPGIVGDTLWEPTSMTPENLAKVARAMEDVMQRFQDKATLEAAPWPAESPASFS